MGLELGKHHLIVRDQGKYGPSRWVKNTQQMPVKTDKSGCFSTLTMWDQEHRAALHRT